MSRARKHDYKGIAALGRGEDTMLVHMTPREVQSLQGIASAHGGSLTINPETGYPEAGWLSSILPMVAAGVLAATGAGAPAAAAIMAATSAGATKLDGGSWMDALKAGAISGVGSAATAGLTGGLGQAGASAPAMGAAEAAKSGVAQSAAAMPELTTVAAQGTQVAPALYSAAGREAAQGLTGDALTKAVAEKGIAGATTNTAIGSRGISRIAENFDDWKSGLVNRTGQNFTDATQGIKNLFNAKDYSAYPGGGSKLLQHSVGTLSPVLTAGLAGELSGTQKDKTPKNKSPYEPYVGPYTMQRPSGGPTEEELAQYYASNNTGDINYFPGQNTFTSPNGPSFTRYAEGGIASLPGPQESAPGAVEGMLSGPGDGMSDSIPANIDGKQEARLADGEFVLPADVVSHIGNGSSKSGSQRLYAMMDAIREARTGNPDQGKQINPDKFLPA